MYRSDVDAHIVPADGDVAALLGCLERHGFSVVPGLNDTEVIIGWGANQTGLTVDRQAQCLSGLLRVGAYAFDQRLIEALQAAADEGLLESGLLRREADEQDWEEYRLEDGVWKRLASAFRFVDFRAWEEVQAAVDRVMRARTEGSPDAVGADCWIAPLLLSEPLTAQEMRDQADENGALRAFVAVDIDQAVTLDAQGFLDLLSERITGTPHLLDIEYQVIGNEGNTLLLDVGGSAQAILQPDRPVLVPIVESATDAPDDVVAAFTLPIDGSVCVGIPDGDGMLIYYEGGKHTRGDRPPTEDEQVEYARIAAHRAIERAPTVAFFRLPSTEGLAYRGYVATTSIPFEVVWNEEVTE